MLRSLTRSLIPALLFAGLASAQATIFPAQLGDFKKGPPATIAVPDLPLYDEYGLQATEQAVYTSPAKRMTATAWRFRDSTGAMAMFQARRPPGATPSKVSKLSVATSDGVIFANGNYVFQFTGSIPSQTELDQLYDQIPGFQEAALPLLMDQLPDAGLIPNSGRYIVGPISLERFEPRIAPSIAAFHYGAEAQLGQYQTPKGKMTLVIFNYPTPGIAREQYDAFSKIPGAVAKRAGPMVAVTIQPPDPDAAERVLAQVTYDANITLNQAPPVTAQQVGGMLITIISLAGLILGLCLIAGIGFGAFRVLLRKFGWNPDERHAMIVLHLGNK